MRVGLMVAAAVVMVGTSVPAAAAPILWTLNGVTFSDGTTASGSFIYDAALNRYSNQSLTVMPWPAAGLPPYTYDNTAAITGASATGVTFTALGTLRYLMLSFTSPLTDRGGSVALASGSLEGEGQNGDTRSVVGGTISGSAVPEPAGWALMIAGFAATGIALRLGAARRSRARRSVRLNA